MILSLHPAKKLHFEKNLSSNKCIIFSPLRNVTFKKCQVYFEAHSTAYSWSRFKGSANVQNIDLKIPLFGRGGFSEELKSILITV